MSEPQFRCYDGWNSTGGCYDGWTTVQVLMTETQYSDWTTVQVYLWMNHSIVDWTTIQLYWWLNYCGLNHQLAINVEPYPSAALWYQWELCIEEIKAAIRNCYWPLDCNAFRLSRVGYITACYSPVSACSDTVTDAVGSVANRLTASRCWHTRPVPTPHGRHTRPGFTSSALAFLVWIPD